MQTWPKQLNWALTGNSSADNIYCTIASSGDPNLTIVGQEDVRQTQVAVGEAMGAQHGQLVPGRSEHVVGHLVGGELIE